MYHIYCVTSQILCQHNYVLIDRLLLLLLLLLPPHTGINATQAVVATHGIQNQLSTRYYGLVGLAMHEAIQKGAGRGSPAALAGDDESSAG
jgi:hypothetical protein